MYLEKSRSCDCLHMPNLITKMDGFLFKQPTKHDSANQEIKWMFKCSRAFENKGNGFG